MPNYTKLEETLLGPAERDLAVQSRPPALAALDDAGLYRLISDLSAACDAAETATLAEGRSAADLMAAALRRAQAERRKRGLKPRPEAQTTPSAPRAADETPAPVAKSAPRRAPASPARKPAGRAKADARKKNDLRTGSRRVTKPKVKTDAPVEAAAPLAEPVADVPDARPAVAADDQSRKKLARAAARKAAAKATKAAEKEARKAARKAAKDAEKAAKKAAKKALKDADKAARKAARKAEKATGGTDPADA